VELHESLSPRGLGLIRGKGNKKSQNNAPAHRGTWCVGSDGR
jgi:hypothetical protein